MSSVEDAEGKFIVTLGKGFARSHFEKRHPNNFVASLMFDAPDMEFAERLEKTQEAKKALVDGGYPADKVQVYVEGKESYTELNIVADSADQLKSAFTILNSSDVSFTTPVAAIKTEIGAKVAAEARKA